VSVNKRRQERQSEMKKILRKVYTV